MEWNVSELYLLGAASCSNCNGSGVHRIKKDQLAPCACVLRKVFRGCYQRFRDCVNRGKYRAASFERNPRGRPTVPPGPGRRRSTSPTSSW